MTGDSGRQQNPKSCHSRNHGLCASIWSCFRLAAEMSLALNGLVSGSAKMREDALQLAVQFAALLPSVNPDPQKGTSVHNEVAYGQHCDCARFVRFPVLHIATMGREVFLSVYVAAHSGGRCLRVQPHH